MKKFKLIALVIVSVCLFVLMAFLLVKIFKPKMAGISIKTDPSAVVFINNEQVGSTPYEGTFKPGSYIIKLIPDSYAGPLVPYDVKVNLVTGIQTVVTRVFGDTEENSSGEVISFERASSDTAPLSVLSEPDFAQIIIDGGSRAFTPYKTSSVSEGEHSIIVSLDGYSERMLKVKTTKGYQLTAIVKLAKAGESQMEDEPVLATPSPTINEDAPTAKGIGTIEVLDTPTGYLRVRNEPSTLGEEVGQVEPGNQYPLLSTDDKTGWFEIEYKVGKSGWISNQYAKKTAELPLPSTTPTPTTLIN